VATTIGVAAETFDRVKPSKDRDTRFAFRGRRGSAAASAGAGQA